MGKVSVNRLLRALVPFITMVLVQRIILFIAVRGGVATETAEFFAFILSAAVCIFLFKSYKFENDSDGDGDFVPALVSCSLSRGISWPIFAFGIQVLIMYLVSGVVGQGTSETELTVFSFISLVILHPILEEYVFRRLIYGELRQMDRIFGCLVQSVMFAIVHNSVGSMVYALASGIVFALLYEKTGRLILPILVHSAVNLRSLLFSSVLADYAEARKYCDAATALFAMFALIAIVIIQGRRYLALKSDEEENDFGDDS